MSVTDKQLQANRENAKLAGVKTEEGKRLVRHNSFKHGMTSKSLLSNVEGLEESEEKYLAIIDGLRISLKPTNYFEEGLIENMAKAQFKLLRFDQLEARCLSPCFDKVPKDFQIIKSLNLFERYLKYKQSLEAQYYRALEFLNRTRQSTQLDLFGKGGPLDTSTL